MKSLMPSAETIRLLSAITARDGHDRLILQSAGGGCSYDTAFFERWPFYWPYSMDVPVRPIRTALKNGWIVAMPRCPRDTEGDMQRALLVSEEGRKHVDYKYACHVKIGLVQAKSANRPSASGPN
jgi:hypothetical protein